MVAVVIVLAVVFAGGSSGGGLPKGHVAVGSIANGLPDASQVAAEFKGAFAAAKQNKVFNFAAVLYDNQQTENTGWLTDQMLYTIAAGVPGLKIDPLFAERNSSAVKKEASQVAVDAQAFKVSGTPGLFINKSGQNPKLYTIGMPPSVSNFYAALNRALGS